MTAIEKVRAKLEASGLGGRVEKTHHQLLTGYWWFPAQGAAVYLGANAEVAIVAIDAEKYSGKRDQARDALAGAEGGT